MPTLNALREIIEGAGGITLPNWEYFEVSKPRWKPSKYPFVKMIFFKHLHTAEMITSLWPTYFSYLMFLLNEIKYGSIIEFSLLEKGFWLSRSSIQRFRWCLKERGIVRKKGGMWYIHPQVGYKGETIDTDVIELFEYVPITL